jgi:hypothetical protein
MSNRLPLGHACEARVPGFSGRRLVIRFGRGCVSCSSMRLWIPLLSAGSETPSTICSWRPCNFGIGRWLVVLFRNLRILRKCPDGGGGQRRPPAIGPFRTVGRECNPISPPNVAAYAEMFSTRWPSRANSPSRSSNSSSSTRRPAGARPVRCSRRSAAAARAKAAAVTTWAGT